MKQLTVATQFTLTLNKPCRNNTMDTTNVKKYKPLRVIIMGEENLTSKLTCKRIRLWMAIV